MKNVKLLAAATFVTAQLAAGSAFATPFTNISPTGADVVKAGATTVGGVVVDLVGLNGAHVVSQLAADSLFTGYFGNTVGTIGSQSGFNAAVTGALGGGLKAASFRFTLYDGDSASGDFDFNSNSLLVNGFNFGNWSSVITQNTDGNGVAGPNGFSTGGFRGDLLDTGWFTSSNASLLGDLFASLASTQTLTFQLRDTSPTDNFYDFKQGLNGSVINVGQGPVVTPPTKVPEPASFALLGIGALAFAAKRRKSA